MAQAARVLKTAILLFAISYQNTSAQLAPTILTVDVDNWVSYVEDVFDVTQRAVNPGVTPPTASRNFSAAVSIADIVAVNGRPARGSVVFESRTIRLLSASVPGVAIGDIGRGSILNYGYEIQNTDGTPIGSVMASGFGGGPAPPGAPRAATNGNFAITGGTGAFLGARGQASLVFTPGNIDVRNASMTEDPQNRRVNGGGRQQYVLHLIPHFRPEITSLVHSSDLTPVTDESPATAGEELSLFATGLGPTRPRVDPGELFPETPPIVNSPVEVTVNGAPAEVLSAAGIPGAVDGYLVSFRLPADTPAGVASIRIAAAWIAGAPATIPVQ